MDRERSSAASLEGGPEGAPIDRRLDLRMFWYVVAESGELGPTSVLARRVLGEWLAVFRDAAGRAVALQDRCLHRGVPLSCGRVETGGLRCGYHGWLYAPDGRVAGIPSMGPSSVSGKGAVPTFRTEERDGYVYVRLADPPDELPPFAMPHAGEAGWRRMRLRNRFQGTVTNCVENFVDVPHTPYVHPGIFRSARAQRLTAVVTRQRGTVQAEYAGETDNLGWFSRLLNPSRRPIRHVDRFHMPNVTCVEYDVSEHARFVITSQSVPEEEGDTLVYTELLFDFGLWNLVAGLVVRWQGQRVIDQDVRILAAQERGRKRYGERFSHTAADALYVFIASIREELRQGRDPRRLPDLRQEIEFWV